MTLKTATMKKISVGIALTTSMLIGYAQPSLSATRVFGDRNSGGPNANIPRLITGSHRILATCVDGWIDSARCSRTARENVADAFCEYKGYRAASSWYYRQNARRRHDAFVLNMNSQGFTQRVATGHPRFFTEITCVD